LKAMRVPRLPADRTIGRAFFHSRQFSQARPD
jgi:hypothetical protein